MARISTVSFLPEALIVQQGYSPVSLFFLTSGEAKVLVKCPYSQPEHVLNMRTGKLFGEVALITNSFRTGTPKKINTPSQRSFAKLLHLRDIAKGGFLSDVQSLP